MAYCILSDIPQKYLLQTKWNFFGEYHGKNYLDGHFGLLSKWIKEAEKAQSILNKKECIEYLQNQINNNNKYKKTINNINNKYSNNLDVNFIIYNREQRPDIINQLNFPDFSSYQCLTSIYNNENYIINGYSTSELKDGICLKSKIIKKKDNRETKKTIEKNKKNIKIITQTHNKLEIRKEYIKKQNIDLDINMEDIIFGEKEVFIDLMNIDKD